MAHVRGCVRHPESAHCVCEQVPCAHTFALTPPAGQREWRIDEWLALPDTCAIRGCENDEADQRGPVFFNDGSMHKVCPEHWEPIFRVLGEQATWEEDAGHMTHQIGANHE
ncbi:hypothetical protein EDD33_2667 [Nocardioides aurantiacus]|uniref:Uncharacterized protein n=2 Tax=Nocardioides aurantiacus TaxID=86796 RepID=A0A3N2CVZ1_9ACTN|nr:hypothetical protein EDD33_2585 [Nocardioides aurantiacus]ROR91792.1 hypothetical protein EDD33_2667 [Nocardioides aurantiacus]